MKKLIQVILLIGSMFQGCEKAEEYSDIPNIEFKDFIFDVETTNDGFTNQVGYLTFGFVDGNGDIGFYENSDTIVSPEIYDGFVYEFTKLNGEFFPTDTTKFVLPFFEEGIYRKHIKGDIEFKIYFIDKINDTIMYNFQIMDREYNLSNLESTPELIVPEWN